MAVAHRGLGRGLGALIPTNAEAAEHRTDKPLTAAGTRTYVRDVVSGGDPTPDTSEPELSAVPGLTLREVSPSDITANPRQPRTEFDAESLQELAHSLSEIGFLQPLVVRPGGDGYELVAGERRWRAAQLAGMASVPVLVRETPDSDLLRDALLENLHRVQLNPLEEAAAYQQLLSDFGCTQEQLATRLGRSRPAVSNALRLLKLPPGVQRRVAAGVLTAGHARALVSLDDDEQIELLATRIVAEGMSVRAVEEAIALGDADIPRPRRKRVTLSAHADVAADLGDRFETRVRVTGSTGRGRIVIEFGSPEDLHRVLEAMKDQRTWA